VPAALLAHAQMICTREVEALIVSVYFKTSLALPPVADQKPDQKQEMAGQ
jgi:energy-converting hydrogenase Eha subunit A